MAATNINTMTCVGRSSLTARAWKASAFAALAVSTLALASCGNLRSEESLHTASVENDYRVRHPLSLAEAEHSVNIPVATGTQRLTHDIEDNIRGFAQDYKRGNSGGVMIAVPSGAVNSGAARAVVGQIRSVLIAQGIDTRKIVVSSYQAQSGGISAPVRLTFVSLTAMTNECGQWPEDLMERSSSNKNWYNFGCANQNNLAAQIANPNDLFEPRGQTPIDAQRRANAIDSYRSDGASLGADTSISIPTQ